MIIVNTFALTREAVSFFDQVDDSVEITVSGHSLAKWPFCSHFLQTSNPFEHDWLLADCFSLVPLYDVEDPLVDAVPDGPVANLSSPVVLGRLQVHRKVFADPPVTAEIRHD